MLAVLLAIPVLGGLLILQTAIISRFPLLQGTADVVLLALIAWALQTRVETGIHWGIIGGLLVSVVSGLPFGITLVGYLLVVTLALVLRRRVWQVPLLAMIVTTFFGTLVIHTVALIALRVAGTPLPVLQALNLVTLPSILLNLLLAVPIYAMISDLSKWVYPEKLEI